MYNNNLKKKIQNMLRLLFPNYLKYSLFFIPLLLVFLIVYITFVHFKFYINSYLIKKNSRYILLIYSYVKPGAIFPALNHIGI